MKNRIAGITAVALSGLVFALPGQALADRDAETIFKSKCRMCHDLAQKKIGPAFADMNRDADVLKATITHGRKMMPAFAGKLTPAEIDAMVAFIESQRP